MAEERKLVTILFADVVGSTAMAGANDPEVVRAVMSRYFDRLTEIAENHGGTVEKFAGDSVMVVFGVPTVHDDDAERAVRAALAARDAVAEMSPSLPIALAIRVGVNSGEAVTSAREDRQFMVSGDPVNVAARLQQAGEAGDVLVGAATESLTRAVIEYERRPPIDAKGKTEPVTAFRALRPRSEIPTQARGVPGLRAAMVGRQRELRLLVDTWGRVVADRRPHLITLVGSGGVGKSRLVAEALAEPALEGATVLRGRCLPYGSGITYWPLVEMLARRLPDRAVKEAEWPAVRARLAVMLGQETAGEAMPDVEAEMVNREIGWAVRRHLQALALAAPVIVVVDDLQWAEAPLVELVQQLTDRMGDVPLLFLAIARPDLLEAHPTWGSGKSNTTTLTLAPLDPEETADLISRLLDVDGLPEALRREVVLRSEGTPLYCEEFLRMLIEDGLVVRDGDAWRATSEAIQIRVPHTVQALLAARLDRLAPEDKYLLQAASVVGERFRLADLAGLLGSDALGALDSVTAKGLLIEGEGLGEFGFRHLLIRDAAYGSIPKRRRGELHEAYALLLERQETAAEQVIGITAHHYERAFTLAIELLLPEEVLKPRAERALRSACALFDLARSRWEGTVMGHAHRTAMAAARSLPDEGGPSARAKLLIQEVHRAVAVADYEVARRHLAEAAGLARAAERADILAEALLADMVVYSQAGAGSFRHLETMLGPTVAAFQAAANERGELEARYVASLRLYSIGELAAFVEELGSLVVRARAVGADGLTATLLSRLAGAEVFRGNVAAGLQYTAEAESLAERLGLTEVKGRVQLQRGTTALLAGRPMEAEVHFRTIIELAEDNAGGNVTGSRFLAYALDRQDRFAEAAAVLDHAIAVSERTGDRWNRCELYAIRARMALSLGELEAADGFLDLAGRVRVEDDVTAESELLHALAKVRLAQGRLDEAVAAARRATASIGQTEYQWPRSLIELVLAEALARQGRPVEARALIDQREAWLRKTGWTIWDSEISRLRGLLGD